MGHVNSNRYSRLMRQSIHLAVLLLLVIATNQVTAQSTYDLAPPMQVGLNSNEAAIASDPANMPTFQFAVAEIGKDGKILISTAGAKQTLTAPLPGPDPSMEMHTEEVEMTYTVMVQVTKIVDGKKVTTMVPEQRTRTRKVSRLRKKKLTEEEEKEVEKERERRNRMDIAKEETENIPYVATTQVQERDLNGNATTRIKHEVRSRAMRIHRGTSTTERVDAEESYDVTKLECYRTDGRKLDSETVKDRLAEKAPVILIPGRSSISPYFELLLKKEAMFVVLPE